MLKYVLRLPDEDYHVLSDEEISRIEAQFAAAMANPQRPNLAILPQGATLEPLGVSAEELIRRLDWLCSLSPGERAFVKALADNPSDTVSLKVFADWLRDQNREEDAEVILAACPPEPTAE